MRCCVVGLGAIGGLLAARLAQAGIEVSALARGATLQAVQSRGLILTHPAAEPGGPTTSTTVRLRAHADPHELGEQSVILLCVKTTALSQVAASIAPLIGPGTTVVSMMNGVPWWFFHGLTGIAPALSLRSVDPQGGIARAIGPQRVVGSVIHMAAGCPAPGEVRHDFGDRIIVGEPDGTPVGSSPRCKALLEAFSAAGFQVEASARIQYDIWFKLWGNMTMNPVSALTGATADRILDDDLVREFLSSAMREAALIGRRLGLPIEADPEERHAVTRKLGAFKTSMLQDFESGRPLEIDALVASVADIGRQLSIATPAIDALLGLVRLAARTRGLYPQAGSADRSGL
jgi:2-dehydropantoate 2-reductase